MMSAQGNQQDPKPRISLEKIIGWVVAIVVALLGAGWLFKGCVPSDDSPKANPSQNSSISLSPSSSPSIPTDDPSATPTAGVQYLSDLSPIDGDNRIKTATLNSGGRAKIYPHSLRSVNPFDVYTFIYEIDGDWGQFEATLGIDSGSPEESVVHFQVYLNGAPYGSGDVVTRWQTKDIRVPVTGNSEIKLVSSTQEGGSKVRAVWGDARYAR